MAKYQATTKLCRECHEDKPVDGFYRGRAVCKECIKKRRRVTYKDNPDKENAERAQRARRAKRQNDFRNAVLLDLLRQRGMTKDDVSRAAFRQFADRLQRGEELEDWEYKLMPPDPHGKYAWHVQRWRWEDHYGALMYPDHLKGKGHGEPTARGDGEAC